MDKQTGIGFGTLIVAGGIALCCLGGVVNACTPEGGVGPVDASVTPSPDQTGRPPRTSDTSSTEASESSPPRDDPAESGPADDDRDPDPDPEPEPEPSDHREPDPEPSEEPDDGDAPYYENCAAVRAAGAAPLYAGDPGYRPGLDRDKDGVACE
ncbi:excalibur calcium-binding domain-containing protein [Stackebrandtia albiflava]|uniref:Excalibur calcium-binding domain-containing protein n=1 Tax=Stackebrandtia albiflava TaxID=406432 RepID=A0A562UYJ8_9ACTN|nr:excalibur calcium-binding domain-containing protein [Stackebrandtia albiflava]TWJ10673.1 excalibur calcium-binding domain-containing protein [Stackebrandtia albiflava]